MIRVWIEPTPVNVPDELIAAVGGHRIVAETLVRRGITDVKAALAFLNPDVYVPASPYDLPNMATAVERVQQALDKHEHIAIWGDFDVDGQTATTLLVTGLKPLGVEVSYYIPHRQREGHGIQIEALKILLAKGVQLVITCDTGIAEHEAIGYAQNHGVDVIVTDHHQLPQNLPGAFACVNPQMLESAHPLHTLPGVGCAYKLIEALYARLGYADQLTGLLDLVALGIVADVAVLTGDTRYLLQRGLKVLQETNRPGLKALFAAAEIQQDRIDEEQIGYSIAPRLNAVGRLGDANEAVELLSTQDEERARILAYRFEGLNNERKLLVQQVFDSAQKQVETEPKLLEYGVLLLSHPLWATGVLGIVANRLVEEYNRPVILITTPPQEVAHGSARSVAGCDITAAIASCSQLLQGYGGHTMAAGISLVADNIAEFRRQVSRAVEVQIGKQPPIASLPIDAYVNLAEVNSDFVAQLKRLAPYGSGHPSLTFAAKNLKLLSHETIGRTKEHCRLVVADESEHWQNVMWWNADLQQLPEGVFDLAYTVHERQYKGKTEVVVQYLDIRSLDVPPVRFAPDDVEVIDYRRAEKAEALLDQFPKACVWSEGKTFLDSSGVVFVNRNTLFEAETLVVYTVPPNVRVWKQMLECVKPREIVLMALQPDVVGVEKLVAVVTGMVKYSLANNAGVMNVSLAAARIGYDEKAIFAALEWIASKGVIRIVNKTEQEVSFELKGDANEEASIKLWAQLTVLIEETQAFWSYFRQASPEKLLMMEK